MDFRTLRDSAVGCARSRTEGHEQNDVGAEIIDKIGGLKGMNLAVCDSAQCLPECYCLRRQRSATDQRDSNGLVTLASGKLWWKLFLMLKEKRR
jgi:hypothetical protein